MRPSGALLLLLLLLCILTMYSASISAPRSTSISATSTWPLHDARCRGVEPSYGTAAMSRRFRHGVRVRAWRRVAHESLHVDPRAALEEEPRQLDVPACRGKVERPAAVLRLDVVAGKLLQQQFCHVHVAF